MSAGHVWRRDDGLLWVEVQTEAVEPSGWRLVVPIVETDQAVAAAPLVVPVGRWHARVHLLTGVPDHQLGEQVGALTGPQTDLLRDAVGALVRPPG